MRQSRFPFVPIFAAWPTRIGMPLACAAAVALLLLSCSKNPDASSPEAKIESALRTLIEAEKKADETVWKKELLAQSCAALLEDFWDRVNQASNKLAVARQLQLSSVSLGERAKINLPLGITLAQPTDAQGPTLTPAEWRKFLDDQISSGWELVQLELRHVGFKTDAKQKPSSSTFSFSAHLLNQRLTNRAALDGNIVIHWLPQPSATSAPQLGHVDASQISVKLRSGPPLFQEWFTDTIEPPKGSFFIDPLIVHDLDGNGLSEIILAAKNRVYTRTAPDMFQSSPLLEWDPGLLFTAILADFTSDGLADFLCARFEGLFLFEGLPGGRFGTERAVWTAHRRLKYAQALTAGDIDGDGDLDLWLGQYKLPYSGGQMPTPYFNANDGHPSYLLMNDGTGMFSDATADSGLNDTRWRRVYTSSFADIDRDHDLDLIVVSDFYGMDLFENNGRGVFKAITSTLSPAPFGFGMAHSFGDVNTDGFLDLLMIGMNSPAADRLNAMNLKRNQPPEYDQMRGPMTYGNRLYLGQPNGSYASSPLNDPIARSGWSWGCALLDIDNDGFPELFVANGHESKQTVREYEPEFWLHDIYVANSEENPAADVYFRAKFAQTRGRGFSYGGYEKNKLYLNLSGTNFVEIGFLAGVALEKDSRNVVADDLDGDGLVDLIVTTFEAWPEPRQTLRIYKNNTPNPGEWVGFRFPETTSISPIGATVSIMMEDRVAIRQVITGDSYRSQHPLKVHFGLGDASTNLEARVDWISGQKLQFNASPNQTHPITLPAQ